MFYDEFVKLCSAKSVSRTKACVDCGVSRTAWHKWEEGATPNGATINKFATYFDVSVAQLLGEERENSPTEQTLDEGTQRLIAAILELPPEKQKALADLIGVDY